MELTVQQIEPFVLSAQGLQTLPEDLQSVDTPLKTYCLLCAVSGSFGVQWEQKSFVIPENCAFLFFPDQTYNVVPLQKPLQLIDIRYTISGRSVSNNTIQKAAKQIDKVIAFNDHSALNSPLALKLSAHAKRTLEAILWEKQKNLLFSQEIVNLYVKTVLLGLIRDTVKPQDPDFSDTAEKIMRYVQEHITESLQNEDAARALSYHPNYINRVIKKTTGMTFHKYVIDEKLSYATNLLLSTGNSITEIAYSLAFNTSSHFSNLFAQKYQCTPSQYRKRRG